ncbi:magnesium transporter MgtC [Exiguobacterium sp. Leaf187]|uniref:Magnesium transporter MgtC n=1 Tax=Exiguobacterium indicum TaxID=296995 RepID=A0A0V8GCY1_9BACL|nr:MULTISPECIES: MgtC/SapB family protein [Exiguobacterium]AHA28818.1 magnesium transporter MgtC [Exiguobacterium sp. MH3]KQS21582.1 magnesium transporter MgtC [Exiguobacterium sp. Leaf187]KSU48085.1 magnesium transporter MgtC [Exiguobacterium enclense]KTR25997.1 magnesium transporter MgtC [Exiguobacterium indicum]NTY08466.1 MgtC/SapB family protein [Exiguobacterium sp. JMULE1]
MNWIHVFQLEDLLKLLLAATLGIFIGFEREIKNKPVGIRTSLVITLISCLLTIVSIKSVLLYHDMATHVQMDPMRLVAQIITGIGFIGAGVILRRPHDIVSGLTTAAIIWSASGIGIAVGAGFIWESIFLVLFLFFLLEGLTWVMRHINNSRFEANVLVAHLLLPADLDPSDIIFALEQKGVRITNIRMRGNPIRLTLRMYSPHSLTLFLLYDYLKSLGIKDIDLDQ